MRGGKTRVACSPKSFYRNASWPRQTFVREQTTGGTAISGQTAAKKPSFTGLFCKSYVRESVDEKHRSGDDALPDLSGFSRDRRRPIAEVQPAISYSAQGPIARGLGSEQGQTRGRQSPR